MLYRISESEAIETFFKKLSGRFFLINFFCGAKICQPDSGLNSIKRSE